VKIFTHAKSYLKSSMGVLRKHLKGVKMFPGAFFGNGGCGSGKNSHRKQEGLEVYPPVLEDFLFFSKK